MNTGNILKKQRIAYYDILRALAIISVIVLHVFRIWPHAEIMNFRIFSLRQIFIFAVPMFLMISGALLLNRDIELKDFFKRRFIRIINPYILYVIIYSAVLFFIMSTFTGFGGISEYLSKVPLEFGWYFWLIFGVYLALPVINKFIQYSSKREIEYFILVLLIGSIFYQITYVFKITHFINLNLFVSPIAYLVLGYYLSSHEFKMSNKKIATLSLLVFIVVSFIKVLAENGLFSMSYINGYAFASSDVVTSYLDLGFSAIVQTSALFLFFRYLYEVKDGFYVKVRNIFENNIIKRAYTSISKASYGMYLFHRTLMVPLEIVAAGWVLTGSGVCVTIVILILALVISSWAVVLIINRIPFIKRFSGYH